MKFLHSETSEAAWEEKMPAGNYKGIHIRFSGTNLTGQTIAVGEFGQILATINGHQFINIQDAVLKDILNQWKGYVEFASASGGAFTYGLFIPFEVPGFENALHVDVGDELYIQFQPTSSVATKVDTWTIELNGVLSNSLETYIPQFLPANESPGAAGTFKKRVPNENIFVVWCYGASLTRIQIERDGELVHSASFASILSETSLRRRIESALVTYGELPLGDQVSDLLSDQVDVEYTVSAGGAVNFQYLAIKFDSVRRAQSQQAGATKVSKRLVPIERKRPLDVQVAKGAVMPSIAKAV